MEKMKKSEEPVLPIFNLDFHLTVDANGSIMEVRRVCSVPRPTCEGCKFEPVCSDMERRVKDAVHVHNDWIKAGNGNGGGD